VWHKQNEEAMEQEKQLQGQIAQILMRFANVHLQVKPHTALVDIHEHSIVVTLENIVPPVERDYARDFHEHELLDKSYASVYACTRRMAEIELENLVNRNIINSIMRVDLESGNALLLFNFMDG
jgi:uncharacterized protein YbcI